MRYTTAQLADAISVSHSWRGVLRCLGISATSAGSLRAARGIADRNGFDYSHFTGQRRWSDSQLADAVGSSRSWTEVTRRLGLVENTSAVTTARGHAERLALSVAHLRSSDLPDRSDTVERAQPELVRRAAPSLAAAWFQLRGYNVNWPLEPARYDLIAECRGQVRRVQVKTTVAQGTTRGFVSLSTSRRVGKQTYDPDEIDDFFIVDERLDAYLIPVSRVAGRYSISLARHVHFKVVERGDLLSEVSSP